MVSSRKNVFAAQVSKSRILENHMLEIWSKCKNLNVVPTEKKLITYFFNAVSARESPSFHQAIRWGEY